jgi:hypothetical protein
VLRELPATARSWGSFQAMLSAVASGEGQP